MGMVRVSAQGPPAPGVKPHLGTEHGGNGFHVRTVDGAVGGGAAREHLCPISSMKAWSGAPEGQQAAPSPSALKCFLSGSPSV